MTIQQMEYFLAAAECLNFSKAAQQLYLTQPTLSRQISSMEAELNMQLFIRDRRAVRLTPAGEALAARLGEVVERYHACVQAARDVNLGLRGALEVGILDGHIVSDFLPAELSRFQEEHPNISVRARRHSFQALADGLRAGTLDLAVTLDFDLEGREELAYRRLYDSPDCLVLSADHPKAALARPRLADFKDETFISISPEDSPGGFKLLLESCRRAGFRPQCRPAPTLEDYMLWVEAGYGVSVLTQANSLSTNPTLRFLPLEELGRSTVVAVWSRGSSNPAVPLFLSVLESVLTPRE